MRAIRKLQEPYSLAEARAKGVGYDDYNDKGALRAQLVEEQRGICCFCGARIHNHPLRMKIAHWLPQDGEHEMDYRNLLGACLGNQGQPADKQHCDTHQGNRTLSKNPANPNHRIEAIVSFPSDGSITSSNADLNRDVGQKRQDGSFEEGVLNLNLAFLRNNRKAALDAFKDGLAKRGHLNKEQLERLLSNWSGEREGELEPYAFVIAYWLRKRLARE